MKAIIPVAGAGTRLRPLTYTQPKPLLLVAGKPILSYLIDKLYAMGVTDYVFVIGYLGEKIRAFVEEQYPHINKEFVTQDKREGSGHAIWKAKHTFKEEDEIYIFFGDAILDVDLEEMTNMPTSALAVKKVNDPREFGVVEYEQDTGIVKKLIEKPKIPKSDMAMVGFYKIKEVDKLIEGLEYNIANNIRTEGEFQLTDALDYMIQKGVEFRTISVDNWYDCGKREVLLETNMILLEREGYASSHLPYYDSSIIIHPVSIGKDCKIVNAIIGPHVTIGSNATIDSAIVKDSIIGNYASIKEVVLQHSVIGNDTSIIGLRQSLNIGDNTEIDFSGSGQ